MSASPFFLSAGRGDLKFWGEDHEPTVVVWESLLESGALPGTFRSRERSTAHRLVLPRPTAALLGPAHTQKTRSAWPTVQKMRLRPDFLIKKNTTQARLFD